MNLLQITTQLPIPANTGGKIDFLAFAKSLSSHHRIHLISFAESFPKDEDIEILRQYYITINIIVLKQPSLITNLYHGIFSSVPINMLKYRDPRMRQLIQDFIRKHAIDFIRIDHMHMAWYAKEFSHIPCVLRKQNVDSIILERFLQQQRNPLKKILAWSQWKKMLRYEAKICKKFYNITISPEDKKALLAMIPEARVEDIPCGIETPEIIPMRPNGPREYTLTFLGSMDWAPNEDGILWFIQEIWPTLKGKYPQLKLQLVGRNPSDAIKAIADDKIVVTGFVKEVIPYLKNTDVFIVPLRMGSGMRIKILEAMSLGLPIVTTTIGYEGIAAEPDIHLKVADNPSEFVNQTSILLDSFQKRSQLGQNARECIIGHYSLPAIAQQWDNLINRVISNK
jgi:glycosyltransferase involved in cell wall biosynthesis